MPRERGRRRRGARGAVERALPPRRARGRATPPVAREARAAGQPRPAHPPATVAPASVERGVATCGSVGRGVLDAGGVDGLGRRPAMPVATEIDGDLEEPRRKPAAAIETPRRADDPQPRLLVEVIDVPPAGVPE